jgi:hypothetical protein
MKSLAAFLAYVPTSIFPAAGTGRNRFIHVNICVFNKITVLTDIQGSISLFFEDFLEKPSKYVKN